MCRALRIYILVARLPGIKSVRIKKSIESVNWEVMFNNESVHKQVSIFREILMNIFSNLTPNKLVTFGDRDPPWMNDFI